MYIRLVFKSGAIIYISRYHDSTWASLVLDALTTGEGTLQQRDIDLQSRPIIRSLKVDEVVYWDVVRESEVKS